MAFCFIDKILEIKAGEFAIGRKNVTYNEPALSFHFPGYPIFPGTQLVEAAAQLSGFLLEYTLNTDNDVRRAVMMQIVNAKFIKPVYPGDQLMITTRLESLIGHAAETATSVDCGGEKRAHSTLRFTMQVIDEDEVHKQQRSRYASWTRGKTLDRPIL